MPSANIDTSASGDTTIVAAVPGKQIVVYGFWLTSTGGGANCFWKSGATTVLAGVGSTNVASGGIMAPVPVHDEWFRTNSGEALVLNLDAAQRVVGLVKYFLF